MESLVDGTSVVNLVLISCECGPLLSLNNLVERRVSSKSEKFLKRMELGPQAPLLESYVSN